ncbi:MAG: ABC transporter permease [Cyclobacteriaceae bacterium]|nr:ABC transporter permease [Cyclobacteriaceae bacterium]MCX7638084.1 ABC transporter permease [Cyclobacteriaceae bacterium]MDW8331003.1 FtsX-like permease family protein [Cyclobacteriaceae bacterium]
MNILVLVWSYLKARPLNTLLNTLLLALGIAVIMVLLLFTRQLQDKIQSNARGIDLVVGAKGSPLQIILCNIFHIDFPTGNIPLYEAEKLARNRLVKTAIPLALGDSYEGYRIIGCPKEYPELYQAGLAEGRWYQKDFEVVIGATVARMRGLKMGDHFTSAHGLSQGGHEHEEHHFTVTGILKPGGTVIDNLIFTSIESVWKVHDLPVQPVDTSRQQASNLVPSVAAGDSTKEITSLLIQYRSPMGAVQLPRQINQQTSMQAASPAFETARLFSIMGVGMDVLSAMAAVLIFISALSIFIALYNSLKERRYDLAIMRTLGATRFKIVFTILLEGIFLTVAGALFGLLLGHGVVGVVAASVEEIQKAGISGIVFYSTEWIILAGSLLLGLLCALVPAIQAYRTDISEVLGGN